MNLIKACDALWELVENGENNLLKYAQASALLDEFWRENHDPLTGKTIDAYASEKIHKVRHYFEDLCGLSDDLSSPAGLHDDFREAVYKLRNIVDNDHPYQLKTPLHGPATNRER